MLLRTWIQWSAPANSKKRGLCLTHTCRHITKTHRIVSINSLAVNCIQRELRHPCSFQNDKNRSYSAETFFIPDSFQQSEKIYLNLLKKHIHDRKLEQITLQIIKEIQNDDSNEGFTENVSTALIEVLSSLKLTDKAISFLKYSRDRGVRPRIHAYSGAIAAAYDQDQYILALRVFEVMRDDGYIPKEVTYSRALSAAHKLMYHNLVLEIYDDIIENCGNVNIVLINNVLCSCARVGDAKNANHLYRYVQENNILMTSSTCHSLTITGGKAGDWELAVKAYEELVHLGFQKTVTICKSAISACSKARKWQKVIDIFESMEVDLQDDIVNTYLGSVLMAYANVSREPANYIKSLELYEKRHARGEIMSTYAHNAILRAYIALDKLEEFFRHAKSMTEEGVEWDAFTHKLIIIAHVRNNSPEKALKLLSLQEHRLGFLADCYREIIRFYSDKCSNYREACRFSNKLMQNNRILHHSDWEVALVNALKIYEKEPKFYWNFRRWMQSRCKFSFPDIPASLLLPEPKSPNDIGYYAYYRHLAPAQSRLAKGIRKTSNMAAVKEGVNVEDAATATSSWYS